MKTIIPSSVMLFVLVAGLTGCCTGTTALPGLETQCVVPPPTTSKLDRTNAWKLAAKLEKLPIDASFEANFTKSAETGYREISEANTTLLILINGANCFLKQGKIGQPLADKLVDAAVKLALAKKGVSGFVSKNLTATQEQVLREGPGGGQVISKLKPFGYKPASDR